MNNNDSYNEITWQENVTVDENINQPSPSAPADKPARKTAITSALFGVAGLLIGGLSVFGIMQLIGTSTKECQDCTCPQCPTSVTSSIDLNTAFFALEPQDQNIIYSPLSIRYGLSLLNAGAAGTTKTQIDNVLGDEALPQYENIPDTLSLANAVFIRDTYANYTLPSYVEAVTSDYDAEVIYDDFSSADKMDNWVSEKTFDLINQIGIKPTEDTEMVLVNALAVQMDWAYQFDEDDTHGRTFYKADGSEIEATTMSKTTSAENVKYYVDDDITLLSLPLKPTSETALEFIAVMPSGSLTDYIADLDLSNIETALASSTSASTPKDGLRIHIPKFKYEYELDFSNDLQSLGITQAFIDGGADFSNMANDPAGLYVGQAVHKANIDFSEEGVKATAITVFSMYESTAIIDEPKPVAINIDHPFLFLIRDKADGTVWFIGAVYEPNLWEDDEADYF